MKLSNLSKIILFPILSGILAIPAIFPLVRRGFFLSDDGGWMIIRFAAFYSSFSDGQFPVRFLKGLNFGYGYPVANFLYPGFMYMATPFHLLGLGLVDSVKVVLIGSFIFSAIFTFLWLRIHFGKLASLLGSVLFIYTPYHLYDLYKRGSVGEIVSMTFIPLALFGIEKKNFYIISVSIFLLLMTHNSIAFLFLPIIFIYTYLGNKISKQTIYGFVTGLLLSSFFTIPAVCELGYTYFKKTSISNPFEYFADTGLVGVSSILILVVSLILFKFKNKTKIPANLFLLFIGISILSIFLSWPLSGFLWKSFISQLLQFPFRALSLLLLSTSFLGAYIVDNFKKNFQIIVFCIFLIVIIFTSYNFLAPKEYTEIPDSVYATNPDTTTVKNEYMPIWVKDFPHTQYKDKVEFLNGNADVSDLVEKSNVISFNLSNVSSTNLRVNTIFYPGWNAYVNNKKVLINYDNDKGVMDIPVNTYSKNVRLVFSETPLRLFADVLSIIGFAILVLYPFNKLIKFKK
jgi:hypothetical protein